MYENFIVDIKSDELLLLQGNDTDPQFHESFWYVVTGSVEPEDDNLTDKEGLKRKIAIHLKKDSG